MSLELATNPPYHSTLPGFHQWLREGSENLVLDTHKHVDNLHTITSHAYLEGRPHQDRRQRVNQMNEEEEVHQVLDTAPAPPAPAPDTCYRCAGQNHRSRD